MNVVVVGAGLGGLSAACHLAGRGHDVLVLEREQVPGGRAGVVTEAGYRIDTGPSVLTMTGILGDAFAAAGVDMNDYLQLHPVDPMYRACYADGSEIRVWHGREAMAEEITATCGAAEAAGFRRFCDYLTDLYRLELPNFIDRNFDSVLDIAKPPGPVLTLLRMRGFSKLSKVVNSYFSDPRLQRLFSFQSMYAGLAPFQALAIYCVITYMDTVEGVYFPEGGVHAVPMALAAAAEKAGATFRYGVNVERVLCRSGARGRVTGVALAEGEKIEADAVVLNPDLPVAYDRLVPWVTPPRVARKGRYSPSCAVWLAGVRGGPPEGAGHHNIHFGTAWESSFTELMERGECMTDPSMLVTSPTVSDPSLAPEGRSTLYVLEPAPNLEGRVDWSRRREPFKEALLRRVAARGYSTDAEFERFYDPDDWERLGMARGTPFSLAHTFFQTGPFRPNNVDRRVPGLVFVGSGTVPGVGVPIVLLSGRLAADRVDELAGAGSGGLTVAVTLEESYARCRRLNRRYGTTYYWSTRLLPAVKRHHVHALYGFCRYADDIVDDCVPRSAGPLGPRGSKASPAERQAALAAFGQRFFVDLERGDSDDAVLKAVVHTVRAFALDPECFRRFLRSMAMDFTVESYETFDDLLDYMDGSAAVIGEMMLPILEPTRAEAFGHARELGIAFQLSNFLRDVGEDLDRGRVYLPQEDLRKFDADPWARRVTPEWRDVMAYEIERTRGYYRSAALGIAMLPRSSARCIRGAWTLYSGILDEIEKADYDVFSHRVRVPLWRKLAVAARIWRPGAAAG